MDFQQFGYPKEKISAYPPRARFVGAQIATIDPQLLAKLSLS